MFFAAFVDFDLDEKSGEFIQYIWSQATAPTWDCAVLGQQVIPQLNELLVEDKPLVLWLLEGQVLSKSELLAINNLCQKEPRIKIVIDMGGTRSIKWQPLNEFIN